MLSDLLAVGFIRNTGRIRTLMKKAACRCMQLFASPADGQVLIVPHGAITVLLIKRSSLRRGA